MMGTHCQTDIGGTATRGPNRMHSHLPVPNRDPCQYFDAKTKILHKVQWWSGCFGGLQVANLEVIA